MSSKLILVIGATGRQGGALIHALNYSNELEPPADSNADSKEKFHILALTRDASSPSAKSLSSKYPDHVNVVEGNLDSEPSIRKVFEEGKVRGGIWGVFCALAFPGLGVNADREEVQGKTVANLSLEYGVSAFIFSSSERGGERDDDKPEILMQDRFVKAKIEQHVKQLGEQGLPWTILRPVFFMENYEGILGSVTVSVLRAGLQPTTAIQLIAVDDIGHVAAGVFKNPESFRNQILCVVGERLTMQEQEQSYKRATGRSMSAIPSFVARLLIAINTNVKHLLSDLERVHGIQADGSSHAAEIETQVEMTKKAYPNLQSFETWASTRQKKTSQRQKDWNGVSIVKLISGRL